MKKTVTLQKAFCYMTKNKDMEYIHVRNGKQTIELKRHMPEPPEKTNAHAIGFAIDPTPDYDGDYDKKRNRK